MDLGSAGIPWLNLPTKKAEGAFWTATAFLRRLARLAERSRGEVGDLLSRCPAAR
jgi:hypothetical protein